MSSTKQPYSLTAAEAASAIASGKLRPSQLVNSCLERIDAIEDKIKAWALVDREGAIATARQLDSELARGQRRGALHGIPMGIKDIFYTAGLPTEAGSRAWAGFIPDYDATSVARLKAAGTVILGKTQTTEFAFSDPAPTHNPWNTEHTPGGSSAGSGAGVAAGMCSAALGSQTLGSVLRPAAYNGVVGFKPQHGRTSIYGVVPVSPTLDHVGDGFCHRFEVEGNGDVLTGVEEGLQHGEVVEAQKSVTSSGALDAQDRFEGLSIGQNSPYLQTERHVGAEQARHVSKENRIEGYQNVV